MEMAKINSRDTAYDVDVLLPGVPLLTDHEQEIIAQAQAYLEDLRSETEAVHERLRTGMLRLRPQAHDEPVSEPPADATPREADDPIFATREFGAPPEAVGDGLVDFDWKEPE
jgi:hypothetical protein